MGKEKVIILMFILIIMPVTGMSLLTESEWVAGKSYNVDIVSTIKNISIDLLITDQEGKEIILKENMEQIQEGVYSTNVKVPSNEEDTIYIIKGNLNDGLNNFTKTEIVRVNKMPSWKRLLKQVANLLGLEIFI